MPGGNRSAVVYAWLIGQHDNVGDTVLRREYANALRRRGPLVVYVGWVHDGFIEGLALQPEDRVFRKYLPWVFSALRATASRRVTIAINSGEFALSRLFALMALVLIPIAKLANRTGGDVVWLGAAVPGRARFGLGWIFEALFNTATLVRWRDHASSDYLAPAGWMPDWAFAVISDRPSRPRRTVGVSLRFDRPYPSEEWLEAVRSLAGRLSLDIVTIAQVDRDTGYAERLAHDLGGRVVPFAGSGHLEQESIVRSEYAGMQLVLSDRLHGLIIAATEGAIPLGWCEASTEKLSRHLDPMNLGWATVSRDRLLESIRSLDDMQLRTWERELRAALERGAALIGEVRDLVEASQNQHQPVRQVVEP